MSEPVLSIERIRQPLTAILGRLDLVEATLEIDEQDAKLQVEALKMDVTAMRYAARSLATWCDEAEKKAREGKPCRKT